MDVLDKVIEILEVNYSLRKSQGAVVQTGVRFDNFVSHVRITLDPMTRCIKNEDLINIFCHGLNSILIRLRMDKITGGHWDMPPVYIFGYGGMGSQFSDFWGKEFRPAVSDAMPEYVDDIIHSAGVPLVSNETRLEIIPGGVRICVNSRGGENLIHLDGVYGSMRVYPVYAYFRTAPPGQGIVGFMHNAGERWIPVTGGNLDGSLYYTPFMGTQQKIVNSEQIAVLGGTLATSVAHAGVYDIKFIIDAYDDTAANKIRMNKGTPFLSIVERRPGIEEIREPFRAEYLKFLSRFPGGTQAINHILSIMGETVGSKFIRLMLLIKEQI